MDQGLAPPLCQPVRACTAMFVRFAALLLAVSALSEEASAECTLEAGPTRTVVSVPDGETLVLNDGTRVRLIGAMSPRAADAPVEIPDWPLATAARRELESLVLGRMVELSYAGRRADRYGTALAQIFLVADGSRIWVQGQMLRRGFARVYALPENTACSSELFASEREAVEANRGLWSDPAYRIHSAESTGELLRLRSTFQIVEGRVLQVTDVRGRIFLNFGADWREDFTVSLRPAARRTVEEAGLDPRALSGRMVRVRGWIDRRGGPYIEITDPSQIEAVAEASSAEAAPQPRVRRSRARAARPEPDADIPGK